MPVGCDAISAMFPFTAIHAHLDVDGPEHNGTVTTGGARTLPVRVETRTPQTGLPSTHS
jgi:hypothetical protein